jgi:nucleoside-diphosphate-sugar epimerase
MTDKNTALIFGISGIVGRSLATHLLAKGWDVIGVSRHAHADIKGVTPVVCDLMDHDATEVALRVAKPATHAFFCTWARQATEAENCRVNAQMLENAIVGATAVAKLRHVALVTGLKHYLGSFEDYASVELDTPFSEDQERLPGLNFYYAQEDVLFAQAKKNGFTWSVARPHTIIGYAPGNAMNLGTSLAVYASLCRETGRPFLFPGSAQAYNGLVDMTEADLLSSHLEWEATDPRAADKAFNVVNGDYFRWRKMWQRIADYFEIPVAPFPGHETPLATSLADAEADWQSIVAKYNLKPNIMEKVAPWWHVDADLGRTQECITDMSRSREAGFLEYRRTWTAFQRLFERLRQERLIP